MASGSGRPDIEYIDAHSTKAVLTGPDRDKTVVIDVRGKDFLGGNILGAVNLPSDRFQDDDDVDEVIDKHLHGKEQVIVHCALSQVRGPFCASRLSSRLAVMDGDDKPKVKVLAQGFNGFVRAFGDDKLLFENLDPKVSRD